MNSGLYYVFSCMFISTHHANCVAVLFITNISICMNLSKFCLCFATLYGHHGVIWTPRRLKSVPTRLFFQQLIHTNSTGNQKGTHCWSFVPLSQRSTLSERSLSRAVINWTAGDSLHKGTVMWKAFPRHDVIMRKEMKNAFEKKTRVRFLAKLQNTNGVSPSVHGHLITVTSHEHHGVMNPRDSDCLFNSSFMLTRKEIELQSASLTLYEEKLPMIDGFSWQTVSNTENIPIIGHALMLSTVLV